MVNIIMQIDYKSETEYIGEYSGSRIYMKRDDKIPFSYGGNKVRIAAELMKDIRAGGYSAVISYGSESSNMNRAVAEMAKAYGIKCYVIIKTEQAAVNANVNVNAKGTVHLPQKAQDSSITKECGTDGRDRENALSCIQAENSLSDSNKLNHTETENERIVRASGAELLYCTGNDVKSCVEAAIDRAHADGFKPYYIYGDSTGSGNEPSLMRASYNEYAEIRAYEQEAGISFDAIVLTAGTGMTIAGLAAAINDEYAGRYGSKASEYDRLTDSDDCSESGQSNRNMANSMLSDTMDNKAVQNVTTSRLIGISAARTTDNSTAHIKAALLSYYSQDESRIKWMPDIKDAYLCGGYGRYNAEIEQLIHHMEDRGIALDPTYTGKSYWGMLNEIKAGRIKGNILFIHTGGYPVYLDWKNRCREHNQI